MKWYHHGRKLALTLLTPEACLACNLVSATGPFCQACQRGLEPGPSLWCQSLWLRAAFTYNTTIAKAIQRFKYRGHPEFARPLAETAARFFEGTPEAVFVPVPLSPRRLRERGYNQAALLARQLGQVMNRKVATRLLFRVVDTPPQASLGGAARAANLWSAFTARRRQAGLRIVIIDDVVTTGSTLNACRHALELAGHAPIGALCLAKTSPSYTHTETADANVLRKSLPNRHLDE